MSMRRLALAAAITTFTSTAYAGPQLFSDARSFAMGGTGVASALPTDASFANPALLAIHQHSDSADDFALVLPSANARYADDKKVIDKINSIQDEINRFNSALSALNSTAVQQSAATLENQLRDLNHDTVRGDAGLGIALQVPSQTLSVGVFSDASLRVTAQSDIAASDLTYLDSIANGTPATPINTSGTGTGGYTLQSYGTVVGAAVGEAGISLAHQLDLNGNKIALGISPKFIQLRTFDYKQDVGSFNSSNFHAADYETRKNGFNADIGAAYQFGDKGQWVAGLSIRNVIPMKLDSVYGRTFHLDPKATVGFSQSTNWHTLSVDLDLTPTRSFGYDDKTQWLAVGGEFNIFETLQLRAGVRQNLAKTGTDYGVQEKTQFTAGVGLSPFGIHLELSGLVSSAEYGAALQTAFTF